MNRERSPLSTFVESFWGLEYTFRRTFNEQNGLLTYSINDPRSMHAGIFLFELRNDEWETKNENFPSQGAKEFFLSEITKNELRFSH